MDFDTIVSLMTSGLTREQAVELYETNWWEVTGMAKAAWLQLNQKLLCMPFDKFHESVEFLLGRPVFRHEFAESENLINEVLTGKTPTFQEVLEMLPANKVVIVPVEE